MYRPKWIIPGKFTYFEEAFFVIFGTGYDCSDKISNSTTWRYPEVSHIQIVLNCSQGMRYLSMLFAADLNSIASRREDISRKFFHDNTKSTSCLHNLLRDPKLPSHNSKLRSYKKFPKFYTCNKRYCSFVQYALSHYQDRVCTMTRYIT